MNGEGPGAPTVSHGVQGRPLLYPITEELAAEALGQGQAKGSALRGGPEGSCHLATCHACHWQVRVSGRRRGAPGPCGLPHTKQQQALALHRPHLG